MVFFLCGLWHGASWTFVAWGFYHGFFLVLERTRWGAVLEKLPRPFRHLYAVLTVMLGWVLFRASTFPGAAHYFHRTRRIGAAAHAQPLARYAGDEVLWTIVIGLVFSVLPWNKFKAFCARQAGRLPGRPQTVLSHAGGVLEIALVLALLLISAIWLAGGTYNPFIYYRF